MIGAHVASDNGIFASGRILSHLYFSKKPNSALNTFCRMHHGVRRVKYGESRHKNQGRLPTFSYTIVS